MHSKSHICAAFALIAGLFTAITAGGAPPDGAFAPAAAVRTEDPLAGVSKEDQARYREAVSHGLKTRELSRTMRSALTKMVQNKPPNPEDVKAYEAALKALDKESQATYAMMSQDRWTDADRTKMAEIVAKISAAQEPETPAAGAPKKSAI